MRATIRAKLCLLRSRRFYNNVTWEADLAPVRAYIDELLPEILEGRIEPERVFDRSVRLEGVPDGYRAMDERQTIKILVAPGADPKQKNGYRVKKKVEAETQHAGILPAGSVFFSFVGTQGGSAQVSIACHHERPESRRSGRRCEAS